MTSLWLVCRASVHHALSLGVLFVLPKVLNFLLVYFWLLIHHCTSSQQNVTIKHNQLIRIKTNSQDSSSSPASSRHVRRHSDVGDDEEHDEFATDARLTFDKSILFLRYSDDEDGFTETKFDPSKSPLHAADLHVL
jgi:hypothetical protein